MVYLEFCYDKDTFGSLVNPARVYQSQKPFDQYKCVNKTVRWFIVGRTWGGRWIWRKRYDRYWKHWCRVRFNNGEFYNQPEIYKTQCCYKYNQVIGQKLPCIKENEASRLCDFYANHIYENNKWKEIDRKKDERSECERVPQLKNICCHSCSL